jgi:D-glycero-D-manno-heptose 1,7-bisphosphate phosphatase
MMRPAVFLDRDDTLMEASSLPPPPPPAAPGDVCDPDQVRLLPDVLGACRRLRDAGFRLIVISNQGVVARGGATLQRVEEVNARLMQLLPDGPGRSLLDAVYICPYHPGGAVPQFTREHPWRKPAPGMILAAAAELHIDLAGSWLVGDAERDVEAGIAAGLRRARCLRIGPHGALKDLAAAAGVILAETPRAGAE